jgi:hypothetical protein
VAFGRTACPYRPVHSTTWGNMADTGQAVRQLERYRETVPASQPLLRKAFFQLTAETGTTAHLVQMLDRTGRRAISAADAKTWAGKSGVWPLSGWLLVQKRISRSLRMAPGLIDLLLELTAWLPARRRHQQSMETGNHAEPLCAIYAASRSSNLFCLSHRPRRARPDHGALRGIAAGVAFRCARETTVIWRSFLGALTLTVRGR